MAQHRIRKQLYFRLLQPAEYFQPYRDLIGLAYRAYIESRIIQWTTGKYQATVVDIQALSIGPVAPLDDFDFSGAKTLFVG